FRKRERRAVGEAFVKLRSREWPIRSSVILVARGLDERLTVLEVDLHHASHLVEAHGFNLGIKYRGDERHHSLYRIARHELIGELPDARLATEGDARQHERKTE